MFDYLKNNFRFGDLVFGLYDHIHALTDELDNDESLANFPKSMLNYSGVLWDPQRYGHIISRQPLEDRSYCVNTMKVLLQSSELTSEERNFVNFLIEVCGEHYGFNANQNLQTMSGKGLSLDKRIIRRLSKVGLLFCLQRNKRIHFLLDDIQLDYAIKKNVTPNMSHEEKSIIFSYTNSELRFIYRNWSLFQNRVFFYCNKKIVPAPWKSNPMLWSNYNPKNMAKEFIMSIVPLKR